MKKHDFPTLENLRLNDMRYPTLDEIHSKTFFYPANLSKRDYQFEMSVAASKENSLIVIPTGLGKTFIAAVLIYNYYRWFPTGKIIFLAHTIPLVMQQYQSISDILQLDSNSFKILTKKTPILEREQIWKDGKIFFATPQIVNNDISNNRCPASQVVLIILDEAHHAIGNNAYCQVVSSVASYTRFFRCVGLTATPSSDLEVIQEIVYGTLTKNIEFRDEFIYRSYVKNRKIIYEIVEEPPAHVEICNKLNYHIKSLLNDLVTFNVLQHSNPSRVTSGQLSLILKENNFPVDATIPLRIATKLLKIREFFRAYGLGFFIEELEHYLRTETATDQELRTRLESLLRISRRQQNIDIKLNKLLEILETHFNRPDEPNSRVIVFCSYRKVVDYITRMLNERAKTVRSIKATKFIGHSSAGDCHGYSINVQLSVLESFKNGFFNTLVATSILEEGLDIGEVDLIVNYDVQKSYTRTIQRMGRTGRMKNGTVVYLLTDDQKKRIEEHSDIDARINSVLNRAVEELRFYENNEIMNPYPFKIYEKIILKKNTCEFERKPRQKNNRKTLTTTELEELRTKYGHFVYSKIALDKYLSYQMYTHISTTITKSAESDLLTSALESIILSSQNSRRSLLISQSFSDFKSSQTTDDYFSQLSQYSQHELENECSKSESTDAQCKSTKTEGLSDATLRFSLSPTSNSNLSDIDVENNKNELHYNQSQSRNVKDNLIYASSGDDYDKNDTDLKNNHAKLTDEVNKKQGYDSNSYPVLTIDQTKAMMSSQLVNLSDEYTTPSCSSPIEEKSRMKNLQKIDSLMNRDNVLLEPQFDRSESDDFLSGSDIELVNELEILQYYAGESSNFSVNNSQYVLSQSSQKMESSTKPGNIQMSKLLGCPGVSTSCNEKKKFDFCFSSDQSTD